LTEKKIHIISFDVPYPADYGGVIDVYYKIEALHQLGYQIHLHCFQYGRVESDKLNEICEKVSYYPRKKRLLDFLNTRPFIVQTRKSKALFQNLLKDNAPILMEGLHCTSLLEKNVFHNRITLVRTHNIEQDYYNGLAKKKTFINKLFFKIEAFKLSKYESILKKATAILCVQENDLTHFKSINSNSFSLPICTSNKTKIQKEKTDPYLLYQGNLSVVENISALKWIIENVWGKLELKSKLIVGGKDPSSELKNYLKKKNIKLIENPSEKEMDNLIQKARIHLLYSNQASGAKLKVLNALNSNGHLIVNQTIIAGTDLEKFCLVCETFDQFKNAIITKIEYELSEEEFQKRQFYIEQKMNVIENCKVIINILRR